MIGYEYCPEIFTGTELPFSRRGLRGRHRRVAARRRPRDHPQPAGHRRDRRPRTCTPTRSSGSPASSPGASTPRSACTRTTTAARRSRRPSWPMMAGADRVEGCLFGHGERTGNVCLVTLGHEPVQPGHRPADRLLRHRRDPSHGRVLHPAAGPPAPPLRRRPGLHRVLRLPPGRDQEGPRGPRAQEAERAGHPVGEHAVGGAVPADRPEGRRPHLRGRHPGQQPVRQGRRRLRAQGRAQARPAAPRCRSSSAASIQEHTDDRGRRDVSPAAIWEVFQREYLDPRDAAEAQLGAHLLGRGREGPARRQRLRRRRAPELLRRRQRPDRGVRRRDQRRSSGPSGGFDVRVLDYAEHALSAGGDAIAAAYVECAIRRRRDRGPLGRRARRQHRDRVAQGRDRAVNRT